MKLTAQKLWPEGLMWFQPAIYGDHRGNFRELFQLRAYLDAGLEEAGWVQDNLVFSRKGALRGLHFQKLRPQAKLIQVAQGAIFDAAVDLRPGSPSWGQCWSGLIIAAGGGQLYVPKGFAHGYQALEDDTIVIYKCSDYYRPADEGGLVFDDPQLALKWPITPALLNARDRDWPTLDQLAALGRL